MVRRPVSSQEVREIKDRFLTALDKYISAREVDHWYKSVNTNDSVDKARDELGEVFVAALLLD